MRGRRVQEDKCRSSSELRLYKLLLCHTPEKLYIECVSREGENKLLCFPPQDGIIILRIHAFELKPVCSFEYYLSPPAYRNSAQGFCSLLSSDYFENLPQEVRNLSQFFLLGFPSPLLGILPTSEITQLVLYPT